MKHKVGVYCCGCKMYGYVNGSKYYFSSSSTQYEGTTLMYCLVPAPFVTSTRR
jgi:hypothetical protein